MGVLKWLENIGEASYQLSNETTAEFGKLDWKSIINARHFYVHHYFYVEWATVWNTLHTIDYGAIKMYVNVIIKTLRERYSI